MNAICWPSVIEIATGKPLSQRVSPMTERIADDEPRDDGQFGVALRTYTELFGGTEFGFYYMNIHSRTLYQRRADQPKTAWVCWRKWGDSYQPMSVNLMLSTTPTVRCQITYPKTSDYGREATR